MSRRLPQWEDAAPPAEPERVVAWTLERFALERLVITTAFGMEGCALIDMYATHGVPLAVVYLDTMFFFPETHRLRDRLARRYPHLRFENRGTTLTPEQQAALHGPALWKTDPDRCCRIRKVEPMRRVLAGADAWVTAISRGQSDARANVRVLQWDEPFGVLKVCPLAAWDRQRVWRYVCERGVPYNELRLLNSTTAQTEKACRVNRVIDEDDCGARGRRL